MKSFKDLAKILGIGVVCAVIVALILTFAITANAEICTENVCDCNMNVIREVAGVITTLEFDFDRDYMHEVEAFSNGDRACHCKAVKSALWVLATDYNDLYHELINRLLSLEKSAVIQAIEKFMTNCNCCCKEQVENAHYHYGGTHENGGRCIGCGKYYQQHVLTFVSTGNTFHHVECSCGWCAEPTTHRFDQEHTFERNGDLRHLVCIDCGQDCWWDCSGWTCPQH